MPDRPSLNKLKEAVSQYLLLGDSGVVDVILATAIANRMDLDAVWLMLAGPSSSGKTELVAPLFGLPFVIPISDLTVNTFASGYKMGGGQQASLLMQYQNGIMVFKDFTSLLSKSRETREIIFGQLREIYEGKYDKYTGTGEHISWQGKMGAIAAATRSVYYTLAETTEMGQRFIYYDVHQPDRFAAAQRAQENAKQSNILRENLRKNYHDYINYVLDVVSQGNVSYEPPQEVVSELLRVADFSALARSPVHTDFKTGLVDSEVDKEMPGRIVKQLISLSAAFIAINRAEHFRPGMAFTLGHLPAGSEALSSEQRKVLYRCAYDSVPLMRRRVLVLLAKYMAGITTAGAATALNLPTESVRKYLYQVNAIGLCERQKQKKGSDMWVFKDERYREVISIVEGVVGEDSQLVGEEDSEEDDGELWDLDKINQQNRQYAEAHDLSDPTIEVSRDGLTPPLMKDGGTF